jgi:hypothetical protein
MVTVSLHPSCLLPTKQMFLSHLALLFFQLNQVFLNVGGAKNRKK